VSRVPCYPKATNYAPVCNTVLFSGNGTNGFLPRSHEKFCFPRLWRWMQKCEPSLDGVQPVFGHASLSVGPHLMLVAALLWHSLALHYLRALPHLRAVLQEMSHERISRIERVRRRSLSLSITLLRSQGVYTPRRRDHRTTRPRLARRRTWPRWLGQLSSEQRRGRN